MSAEGQIIPAMALFAASFVLLFISTRLLGRVENLLVKVDEKNAENRMLLDLIEDWNRRHQEQEDQSSTFERCFK